MDDSQPHPVRDQEPLRGAHGALLLAALAFGAWLRARSLGGFAITHWDEGLAFQGARWFATLGAEGHYSPTHAPPLVPALFALPARLFGALPALLVWVNVLLSVLGIPLLYALARSVATPRAGLIAAWLGAGSGLHVLYARSLLTESAYAFLFLLALVLSARYLAVRRARWLVLTTLSVIALQYTKYNGCLAAWPLLLVFVGEFALGRSPWRASLLRCLAVGIPILVAIALNVLAIQFGGDLPAFLEHYGGYVGQEQPTLGTVCATLAWVEPISVCVAACAGILVLCVARNPSGVLVQFALLLYVLFLFRYTFYLRLFLPVITLLLVHAAVGVDALVARLPRAWAMPVFVLLAGLVGYEEWTGPDQRYRARFNGYTRAATFLNGAEAGPRVLFASQRFVWGELAGEPMVVSLPSERASAALEGAAEVRLVLDVGAFSRLRDWNLERVYARLDTAWREAEIENTLGLDVLQNNLTLAELQALPTDPELARRVLGIHIFKLPAAVLTRIVAEEGTAQPVSRL